MTRDDVLTEDERNSAYQAREDWKGPLDWKYTDPYWLPGSRFSTTGQQRSDFYAPLMKYGH